MLEELFMATLGDVMSTVSYSVNHLRIRGSLKLKLQCTRYNALAVLGRLQRDRRCMRGSSLPSSSSCGVHGSARGRIPLQDLGESTIIAWYYVIISYYSIRCRVSNDLSLCYPSNASNVPIRNAFCK